MYDKSELIQLKDKIVFVTGATGRLGRVLVDFLINTAQVKKVIAFIGKNHQQCFINDKIKIVIGDVLNRDSLVKEMGNVDIVFHLAALTNATLSKQEPLKYFKVNGMGTMNVLDACRVMGVKKMIYVSTSHVYGITENIPVDEGHLASPLSIYAASKYIGEITSLAYRRAFELDLLVARIPNIYGPGFGKDTAIGLAIQQLVDERCISLKNYDVIRDFIFIYDVVEALVRLSTNFQKNDGNCIINISSGVGISLRQIVKLLAEIGKEMGLGKVKILENEKEVVDVIPSFVLDNSLLIANTGWKPKTSIEKGLRISLQHELKKRS